MPNMLVYVIFSDSHLETIPPSDDLVTMSTTKSALDPCGHQDFWQCHVAVSLWKIFSPLFLIVGLGGNLLSIAVLSRKRLRYTTTSVYLRLLAVVDTSVLIVFVLHRLVYYYLLINFKLSNNLACKIYSWLSTSVTALSIWLLSLIAIDRLILVKYPVWAKSHCTQRSAVVAVGILSVALFIINSHYLALYSRIEVFSYSNLTNATVVVNVVCGPSSVKFKFFYNKVWPVFMFLLYSIVPLICLATCNVILIKELKKRSLQKQARRSRDVSIEQEQRNLRSVTKMLVVVCIFFIIISVPTCIHLIIESYLFDGARPRDRAKRLLTWSIVTLILHSNNTVNFFLYCLSGSVFRKDLAEMFAYLKVSIQRVIHRGVHPAILTVGPVADSEVNKAGTSSTGNTTNSTTV